MKRLLTFIIAAIIFFPCGAQSWEEIKSSRQYIYGEGWGSKRCRGRQERACRPYKQDFRAGAKLVHADGR